MTGQHRPRRTDSNGIPKPVVRWYTGKAAPYAFCRQCIWKAEPADLALCRLHIKTYPDHFVMLRKVEDTAVFAETTDGQVWVEAVNNA